MKGRRSRRGRHSPRLAPTGVIQRRASKSSASPRPSANRDEIWRGRYVLGSRPSSGARRLCPLRTAPNGRHMMVMRSIRPS
jgi:hypothetical protein